MTPPVPPSMIGDCFCFEHGGKRITALCDQSFDIDKRLFIGADPEAIGTCLSAASTPTSCCNAYLVETKGATILIDAGAGAVPFDGRAADALAKSGIAPERIDHILLTHLHLDHVGGLLREDAPLFPGAEVWLAAAERDFWFDDAATDEMKKRLAPSLGDDFVNTHTKIARNALAAYDGRIRVFSEEREILPDVKPVPLHGHTPGHTGYLFGSGGEDILFWGDVVHAAAVQFSLPDAGLIFDWNAEEATAARKRAFAEAADGNWLIVGMHLPFPGVGRVRQETDAYTFVPFADDGTTLI